MAVVGNVVIGIIMVFVLVGAIAAIRDSGKGIGKEFTEGLHSIGPIFLPVAGIMASIPYLSQFTEWAIGPLFNLLGADPAMAATTFIAVDMGGYQLAESVAADPGNWLMAAVTGYMAGATIVFSIPVGLAMLQARDHKYMALGVMSGVLTIPIGVFVTTAILAANQTALRAEVSTDAAASYRFSLPWSTILLNLVPLTIVVVLIALGLRFVPKLMVTAFIWLGKVLDAVLKIVLALSIVEYFTGVFTKVFGAWGFDPIIADADDQFRALEIAGYIGIMLAGAFPMVYAIRTYLAKPLSKIGGLVGISPAGSAGILAAAANVLALFHLVKNIPPKDKVRCIAFAVCSAFLLGDHLAFTANFQPNMILALLLGKLTAGILGIALASWIAVPTARRLEAQDRASWVIAEDEYIRV
ncbi:ethanolamine transporter [Tamaricihabitans halophyticus]|uniref:Ethanolamine transporter n=1 Tax=Tamaricihabitans halophyticus TaxID=1262583 RepID=A0A4R2QKV4_9PSEU|nr:ethanolamine utilization protein EutH [Tamaricihabitans halophyticus]TCP50083.1 ethanolamine transporter [Tamaricihabitans halophyticus]